MLTVTAYAHKIGLCLAAKYQTWRLISDVQALETILKINTAMEFALATFAAIDHASVGHHRRRVSVL